MSVLELFVTAKKELGARRLRHPGGTEGCRSHAEAAFYPGRRGS